MSVTSISTRYTYIAVKRPAACTGRGESGVSEKGENAEMKALAVAGVGRGERTAIIMATTAIGSTLVQDRVELEAMRATTTCRVPQTRCTSVQRQPDLVQVGLVSDAEYCLVCMSGSNRWCLFGGRTARRCDLKAGRLPFSP